MNTLASVLHKLLANNIVSFTFEKVDGTIRHAIGTRNLSMAENYTGTTIPTPKGEEQPNSYYDVEKMGWRSYKPENLIEINGFIPCAPFEKKEIYTLGGEELKKEIDKRKTETDNTPANNPMGGIGGIMGDFNEKTARKITEDERKLMELLNKEIEIVPLPSMSKPLPSMPKMGGTEIKVGQPIGQPMATERGIELPLGDVSVDTFAKLVAHYVVLELVEKLTK